MSKKVIYDNGSLEITFREMMFGIAIFFVYLASGFVIYNAIDRSIESHNLRYTSAVWVQDKETFKNRLETDNRDAFVYGDWSVIDPVDFNKWNTLFIKSIPVIPSGNYSKVRIIKEHYTKHTRRVTYTDSQGKSHARIEVYWTWDTVWDYSLNSRKIKFNDVVFEYDAITPENITDRIEFITRGSDRWKYYASDTNCSGIAFFHIENKDIGKNNSLDTSKQNSAEDFQACVDANLIGNYAKILFRVLFIAIGIGLIFAFFILENDWLE